MSQKLYISSMRIGTFFDFFSREGLNRVSGKMFNKNKDDDDEERLAYSKQYPDINELDIGCWW